MKMLVLAILLLGWKAPALGWKAPNAGWKRYDNGRFGFSVCYPPELIAQREADNGDGREFKSRDGKVTARAYGNYEQPADSGKSGFAQELDFALQYAKEKGYAVGYKVVKPHLFAVSGTSSAGMVWYRKEIEAQDRAVTLEFEYPQATRAVMDAVVAKMSGCLVAGHMSD